MMDKKDRKYKIITIVFILLLAGTVAFSYVKTNEVILNAGKENLKIFDINYNNLSVKSGSVQPIKNVTFDGNDVSFDIKLDNADDFFYFIFDVINNDKSDVMLISFYDISLTKEEKNVYHYSVTYDDGVKIEENDILRAGKKERIKVRVNYKEDVNPNKIIENDTDDNILRLNFSLQYGKAGMLAKEVKHKAFAPKVGEYVRIVSSKDKFKIDTSKTGYTGDLQKEIKPSEVTMYRVIKVNQDKTIDIAAVNCANDNVYFSGETGYLFYVGYLNVIANSFSNSNYVLKTRMIGYNGQTGVIEDKSMFKNTAPWTKSTNDNSYEKQGGGDILQASDLELIKNVFGSLYATKVSGEACSYYLGSRYYYYRNSNSYYWSVRVVENTGKEDFKDIYSYSNRKFHDDVASYSVRPILTLKKDIIGVKGDGTFDAPYLLID